MKYVYRNLPNIVSILGVLPLCILLREDAFVYLCPLIVFNNVMDDLDGFSPRSWGSAVSLAPDWTTYVMRWLTS